jgi:hypothetical protein
LAEVTLMVMGADTTVLAVEMGVGEATAVTGEFKVLVQAHGRAKTAMAISKKHETTFIT